MLYIVQVIMWGAAEAPLIFCDPVQARAAYTDCTRTRWGQRYAAYCDHHGLEADSFSAAEAFMQTIDISEKSTVHLWTATPQGTDPEACPGGSGELRPLAAGIDALREGLRHLLADVEQLALQCGVTESVTTAGNAATGAVETTLPAAAARPEPETEESPESRATPEWRDFVALIQRSFNTSRNQAVLLPRDNWRQDVYSSLTSLEYWDWVADRTKKYRKAATMAGYKVAAEEGVLGCYRFATPEAAASEDCFGSEWEAWCAAGLHLKAGRESLE